MTLLTNIIGHCTLYGDWLTVADDGNETVKLRVLSRAPNITIVQSRDSSTERHSCSNQQHLLDPDSVLLFMFPVSIVMLALGTTRIVTI